MAVIQQNPTGNIIYTQGGSAASPDIMFLNSSTSGFFLKSDSTIGVSCGGVEIANFSPSGISAEITADFADGTAALPSLAPLSDPTTGVYFIGASHKLLFSTNGITAGNISSAQVWQIPGSLNIGNGTNNGANVVSVTGAPSTALSGVGQSAYNVDQIYNTSGATTSIHGYRSALSTLAAAYTCAEVTSFRGKNPTIGAASTATRVSGAYLDMPTGGGTGNAILTDNLSFTGNYGLNLATTNPSLFAGPLQLTGTSNQLVLNPGAHKFTFTVAAPAADVVLTIPDPGQATANVVLDQGAYTIAGALTLSSALSLTAASNQLVFNPGAHKITLTGAAPAADVIYTLPDAGGAASFVMNAGNSSIAGIKTFSTQAIITGTATNDSAAAGVIGEYIQASRVKSAATGATSTTTLNVTASALSLTAGDWDVSGCVVFLAAATTSVTLLKAAISKTSATLPATDTIGVPTSGEVSGQISTAANIATGDNSLVMPTCRISLSGTTNIFLVANATFSVSTLTVYGSLNARRVR
jgi:hypothetical protein